MASDGRRTPPARTRSVTLFWRNKARPRAAAPSRHQAYATPSTAAGSAAPSSASTKTSRPAARQESTRRRGSPPSPAMMPSLAAFGVSAGGLSDIRLLGLADGPARIGADKADDVVDRRQPGKALGGLTYPIAQGPRGMKQKLIGVAQPLNVLAAEAAALHADDVQTGQASAVAHYLAIGDN